MRGYFIKYCGDKFALIKMEAPGKLNAGGAKAYIFRDGKWIESPDHVIMVLYGGEYDDITEAEAMKLTGGIA